MNESKKQNMERPWLKLYGNIPTEVNYTSASMAEVMLDNCESFHNYDAYKFTKSIVTAQHKYDEYGKHILDAAKMLIQNGVKKGDKVIFSLPYLPETYHIIYAIAALGAVMVPLHPQQSQNAKRMANIIKNSGASTIVCLDQSVTALDQILDEDKQVDDLIQRIIYIKPINSLKQTGLKAVLNPLINMKYQKSEDAPESVKHTSTKFTKYEDEIKLAKTYQGSVMADVKGTDVAAILYTSGTSGNEPDGCMHTHDAFNKSAIAGAFHCDCLEPGDKAVIIPPPSHCYGLVQGTHSPFMAGITQIIVPNPKKLEEIANVIKLERPDILITVPKWMSAMRKAGYFDDGILENNKLFMFGGSSVSNLTYDYWQNRLPEGIEIREGYGNTQTLGGTCLSLRVGNKRGYCGVPLAGIDYKLHDVETGKLITEPNKPGRAFISGNTVMTGVVGKENPDELVTDENGVVWYDTSDLMVMDEEGRFKFLERLNDIFKTRGGNFVNPRYINEVLYEFGIEDSCIFHLVDELKDTEKIVVAIEYVGEESDKEVFKQAVFKKFQEEFKDMKFAIPNEIMVMEKLPLNLNTKPIKADVKEAYNKGDYRFKLTR